LNVPHPYRTGLGDESARNAEVRSSGCTQTWQPGAKDCVHCDLCAAMLHGSVTNARPSCDLHERRCEEEVKQLASGVVASVSVIMNDNDSHCKFVNRIGVCTVLHPALEAANSNGDLRSLSRGLITDVMVVYSSEVKRSATVLATKLYVELVFILREVGMSEKGSIKNPVGYSKKVIVHLNNYAEPFMYSH
ncbi:hypothetical protein HW555_006513, partial [Spodoptera exigua]